MPQEKLKTMLMQNFGRQTKCIVVNVQKGDDRKCPK